MRKSSEAMVSQGRRATSLRRASAGGDGPVPAGERVRRPQPAGAPTASLLIHESSDVVRPTGGGRRPLIRPPGTRGPDIITGIVNQ